MRSSRTVIGAFTLAGLLSLAAWYVATWDSSPFTLDTELSGSEQSFEGFPEKELAASSHATQARTEAQPPELAKLDSQAASETSERMVLVQGRVLIPHAAPFDPTLEVVAIELRSELNGASGSQESLRSFLEGDDFPRTRVEVNADGSFELSIRRAAFEFMLFLDGRFLYLEQAVMLSPTARPERIELEPQLGACVVVQATGPTRSEHVSLEGTSFELKLYDCDDRAGASSFSDSTGNYTRASRLADDSGRAEFRAIPEGCTFDLVAKHSRLVGDSVEIAQTIQVGELQEIPVALTWGANIAGRVLDLEGRPVRGAWVSIKLESHWAKVLPRSERESVATDANGRFLFEGVNLGTWNVLAASVLLLPSHGSVELSHEQETGEIELVVEPGQSVSGTVRWPNGELAANATVVFWEEQTSRRLKAQANESGQFEVVGLSGGHISLKARAVPTQSSVRAGTTGTYRGGWYTDIAETVAGESDIALTLMKPLTLRGRIVDDLGEPIQGKFWVRTNSDHWATEQEDRRAQGDFENTQGEFELFGFEPGVHKIRAVEGDHYMWDAEKTITLPLKEELVLTVTRPSSVEGTVVDASGTPVPYAKVDLYEYSKVMYGGRRDYKSTHTDESGAFEFQELYDGPLLVAANHADWASSTPITLNLPPGEFPRELELVLRIGGALTGMAYDRQGNAAAGREIAIGQVESESSLDPRITTTDRNGQFNAQHLEAGEYCVILSPLEAPEPTLMNGRDFVGQDDTRYFDIISSTTRAMVSIVDSKEAHVTLGQAQEKHIRVFGAVESIDNSTGIYTFLILREGQSGLESLKSCSIGTDGAYQVLLDEPGDYLFVLGKGQHSVEGSVRRRSFPIEFSRTIPDVEEYPLDFDFPQGTIRGRMFSPDGKPASEVIVTLDSGVAGRSHHLFGLPHLAETNDNGEFEFGSLTGGEYTLRTRGDVWSSEYGSIVLPGLSLIESGTLDGLEIRLPLKGTIRGTVHDAEGIPLDDFAIFARDSKGHLLSNSGVGYQVSRGDFYLLALPVGEIEITARQGRLVTPKPVRVQVSADETPEISLVLEPGTMLRVAPTDGDGNPVRCRLSAKTKAGAEVAYMTDALRDWRVVTAKFSSATREIGPLAPGEYTIVATSLDGRSASTQVQLKGEPEQRLELRFR